MILSQYNEPLLLPCQPSGMGWLYHITRHRRCIPMQRPTDRLHAHAVRKKRGKDVIPANAVPASRHDESSSAVSRCSSGFDSGEGSRPAASEPASDPAEGTESLAGRRDSTDHKAPDRAPKKAKALWAKLLHRKQPVGASRLAADRPHQACREDGRDTRCLQGDLRYVKSRHGMDAVRTQWRV